MESDEECNTGLCLGLGIGATKEKKQKLVNKPVMAPCFDLAFELCPKEETMNVNKGERFNLERHQYYQNVTCSTDSDNNNNNNDRRKKLRLTKEQSSMLESTFKLHNTLNPVLFHSYQTFSIIL